MRKTTFITALLMVTAVIVASSTSDAFEIITAQDFKDKIIITDYLIPTADNFIVLYDVSGSMADEYKAGVQKLDAELQILQQQNAILPELGYMAGLYSFTPFKAFYDMQPYNQASFQQAIDRLPSTKTAGNFAGQPTPLAEGIAQLDPILAKLSGKTAVFIFSDGTYTFDKVSRKRPLDVAKPLADKYDVCFYLISSATTATAEKLLDDLAALNECSRVIPFDALYQNPVWAAGALFVMKSTVNVVTVTDRKIVGVEVNDINFALDQVEIQPGDHDNLMKVARFLQDNPKSYAVMAGFSDSSGNSEYNLRLSRMRAQSAKNYILEQSRIDPDRVMLFWYGATNFVADNDTPEGRAKNRRVELAIGMLD